MVKRLRLSKPVRKWMTAALSLILAAAIAVPLLVFPNAAGSTQQIPGTYLLSHGARNGFNYFHMEGNTAADPGTPFWRDTFCTHKDYNSAPGTYVYYYNTDTTDTDPVFLTNVLNQGTSIKNGIEMTLAQYRALRYCMLYTNANRDSRGQYAYWTYLGRFIPERYSAMSRQGDPWQEDWPTKYFGAKADPNFMGLGPIADGQTIDIGAEIDFRFTYNGSTTIPPTLVLTEANPRSLAYKIEFTAGSDPVLAQLNCGPNKDGALWFDLRATSAGARFYGSPDSMVPITSVRVGDPFYVEYNPRSPADGIIAITAKAQRDVVTKVLADEFFLHPNSQNQINVAVEKSRPQFGYNASIPEYTPPEDLDWDYGYQRPGIAKQVSEDNRLNNQGDYVDILRVAPLTDVIHKMTVTSTDPKGTILTFQNRDYDLYPSKLEYPDLYNSAGVKYSSANPYTGGPVYDSAGADKKEIFIPSTTALVYDAQQLLDAIVANKNIKQMANIIIPANWRSSPAWGSATRNNAYQNAIFDGNGFYIDGNAQGGSAVMSEPLIRLVKNSVLYRVSFVNFNIQRPSGTLFDRAGTLADTMDGQGSLIDCYVQGKATITGAGIVGGVVGEVFLKEIYGVKARVDLTVTLNDNLIGAASGGMFGMGEVTTFDNIELMAGSIIRSNFPLFGGIAGNLGFAAAKPGVFRDLKADYVFNGTMSRGADGGLFGGLIGHASNFTLIERCFVYCTFTNANRLENFAGLVYSKPRSDQPTHSEIKIINCAADINGDVVKTQAGAGIFLSQNSAPKADKITIESCHAKLDMEVTFHGGAGIYFELLGLGGVNESNGGDVAIDYCFTEGIISAKPSDSIMPGLLPGTTGGRIAGIAVTSLSREGPYIDFSTPIETEVLYHGTITNCVSEMILADSGVRCWIGGMWATSDNGCVSYEATSDNEMFIENCLYRGTLQITAVGGAEGETLKGDIFTIDKKTFWSPPRIYGGLAKGNNNHSTRNTGDVHTGPNGEGNAPPSGLWWLQETLGLDIVGGDKPDPDGDGPIPKMYMMWDWFPMPTALHRYPRQRVYVTDYYHRNNVQEFIQHLYYWDGTQFIPLWNLGATSMGAQINGASASDPNAELEIYMPRGTETFEFYYFVSNPASQAKNSGQHGAWDRLEDVNGTAGPADKWQNTVKITPRDSQMVFEPGKQTQPKRDWPGAWDDDWVIIDPCAPDQVLFNVIKMTSSADYPIPLNGCEFELYRSDAIYTNFTGINPATAPGWSLMPDMPLKPSDYMGLDIDKMPIITPGSYILKETKAPQYYSSMVGRMWYLVYSGGELRAYSNATLQNQMPLGEETGILPVQPNTLIYGLHIENFLDKITPRATVSVVKWNETGTVQIKGTTVMKDGLPYFNGAVYALRKFEGDNWTGESFGYGNMMAYGTDEDNWDLRNWCDIIPGYYHMVEIRAPEGYSVDPTPIKIHFDGTTLHIDTLTHDSVNVGLNATVSGSGLDKTVNARDKKFEHKITLRKYVAGSSPRDPIFGMPFNLYHYVSTAPHRGVLIETESTVSPNGEVTFTLPAGDGKYVLQEEPSSYYQPIPDYILEVRNGELFIKGGPHNYDFKVVRGLRDMNYYVVLEPDGAATPVNPGAYPEGLTLQPGDAAVIGLLRAILDVPNEPGEGPQPFTIEGKKKVFGASAPGKSFFVTLTEVTTAQGGTKKTPSVLTPNPMEEEVITTGGENEYTFTFNIPGLPDGTYHFEIAETAPLPLPTGWSYDGNTYVVTVVVTGGVPKMPGGSEAGFTNVTPGDYPLSENPAMVYTAPANAFDYSARLRYTEAGETKEFRALCAEYNVFIDLRTGQTVTRVPGAGGNMDHTFAALASAVNHAQHGSKISDTMFFDMFGVWDPWVSTEWRRSDLTQAALWLFEVERTNLHPGINIKNPGTWPPALYSKIAAELNFWIGNGDIWADLNDLIDTMRAMMAQYALTPAGQPITNLTASIDGTGKLIVGYEGFDPPEARPMFRLNWSGDTTGLTVTKNGNPFDPVHDFFGLNDDVRITYTGTGTVNFVLEDTIMYLIGGSIRGTMLQKNSVEQKLICGYAEFATLECAFGLGAGCGGDIVFENSHTNLPTATPTPSPTASPTATPSPSPSGSPPPTPMATHAVIEGRKEIDGPNFPGKTFTFLITQVKNAAGEEWEGPGPAFTDTDTTSGEGTFSFTIPNLTEGVYFYIVEEQPNPGDGWEYDPVKYIVTVNVSGSPLTAVYRARKLA